MKEKVAIATVQGKAYFLIVKNLKKRNIPFISLIPGGTVPIEVKVVITTENEKHRISHQRVIVYNSEMQPDALIDKIRRNLQGKEVYEKIVIGVDPGDVFGLAVIADGKVIETANCFSIQDVLIKISGLTNNIDFSSTVVVIKIGNGVPAYRDLLEALDAALPPKILLEVVSEAGTNRPLNEKKHRRGLRDIASAMLIARRKGHVYHRRKTCKPNGCKHQTKV